MHIDIFLAAQLYRSQEIICLLNQRFTNDQYFSGRKNNQQLSTGPFLNKSFEFLKYIYLFRPFLPIVG